MAEGDDSTMVTVSECCFYVVNYFDKYQEVVARQPMQPGQGQGRGGRPGRRGDGPQGFDMEGWGNMEDGSYGRDGRDRWDEGRLGQGQQGGGGRRPQGNILHNFYHCVQI